MSPLKSSDFRACLIIDIYSSLIETKNLRMTSTSSSSVIDEQNSTIPNKTKL